MQHTIVAFTQVAVLAGDYLLARASVLLAKLDNVDVVQIMASALDALVQFARNCVETQIKWST